MPGTVVRDALAPNLLAGLDLDSTGSETGDSVDLSWPKDVAFVLETGTVTGTNPTIQVTIEGSDTSDFSASGNNKVSVVAFPVSTGTNTAQSNKQYQVTTYVGKRYVRAVVTLGGTSPDYSNATLRAVLPHDRRVRATTSAN